MKLAGVFLALLLVSGFAARADELHLKDGTKITGTIVGYQGTSFRVKTSYGYALVDRGSVVSITLSNSEAQPPAPNKAAEHKADPVEAKADASRTAAVAKASPISAPAEKASNAVNPASSTAAATLRNQTQETAAPTGNASAAASTQKAPPATASAATPAVPTAATAADPTPAPIPVREEVQDNLYTNETYGFHIYKPPDWELIDGARAALPGAIAALGTADQTTYLLVGLDTSSETLAAHVAETNERLGESFDGFQPGPLRQTTVAGLHAYEYQFQGVANNQSWAGTVVLFSRGENIFTIFGVTAASSDLVQIQENVISRAIASLQFTKPQ